MGNLLQLYSGCSHSPADCKSKKRKAQNVADMTIAPHLNRHNVVKKRIFAPFFTVQYLCLENLLWTGWILNTADTILHIMVKSKMQALSPLEKWWIIERKTKKYIREHWWYQWWYQWWASLWHRGRLWLQLLRYSFSYLGQWNPGSSFWDTRVSCPKHWIGVTVVRQ